MQRLFSILTLVGSEWKRGIVGPQWCPTAAGGTAAAELHHFACRPHETAHASAAHTGGPVQAAGARLSMSTCTPCAVRAFLCVKP